MKKFSAVICLLTLCLYSQGETFKIKQPDYNLSPYTGLTRRHWIDADRYLLEGAFRHIRSLDDAMYFRRLGNVCYPRPGEEATRRRGATLEGMARTLFLAAPLLREDSAARINGIRLADYYRRQLSLLVDTASPQHVPHRGSRGPCQDLVEFGALAISFFVAGDVIWDPLPKAVRDSLYAMIESYADGPTIAQNWRFFNVLPMSFFKTKGYRVNDALLEKYLLLLLGDYRGDGWYLDNPNYDYYSMWAYQLYGKLWSVFFGRRYYPLLAARFEKNYEEMFESYPFVFGRDGTMNMWGRSNLYRFASTAPLAWGAVSATTDGAAKWNAGWMRRIASGCLLQFLENPDFLSDDGVPAPGWYGLFDPVLQGYSTRGSVYWCAKAFLPLILPRNNIYWSAIENEGAWDEMKPNTVVNHWLKGPLILETNYPNSGASEIRAWCDYDTRPKWSEQFRGSEQYNRLAYNTLFPWMADGAGGEVSMNYMISGGGGQWEPLRRYTIRGFNGKTLTRTVRLQSDTTFTMTLRDTPLPDGMLREDSVTGCSRPARLRLGHYSLTGTTTERVVKLKKNHKAYLLGNEQYELAMIPLRGFTSVSFVHTTGLHPVSKEAATINGSAAVSGPTRLSSLLLFKKGRFTKDELDEEIAVVTAQYGPLFP